MAVTCALVAGASLVPLPCLAQATGARPVSDHEGAPSVRRAEVHVVLATGERELDSVRERVSRATSSLARCDRAAHALPGEPQVTVRLEIDVRGRVTSAAPITSEVAGDSDRWHRCVEAALSELRFARGGRGIVDVVVAWRFQDPADAPGVPGAGPEPILAYPAHQRAGHGGVARHAWTQDPALPREIPRDEIQRIVREGLAPVRRCYERESLARPELAGRLRVRFVIDRDGSVGSAEAVDDELGSAALTACVRDQVRRWRFPPHAGIPVTVVYPFVFRRE